MNGKAAEKARKTPAWQAKTTAYGLRQPDDSPSPADAAQDNRLSFYGLIQARAVRAEDAQVIESFVAALG
jgi:hypothetical protein